MKNPIQFLLIALLLVACNNKNDTGVENTKVRQGTFVLDLTEEGEVVATNSITISAPAMSRRFGQLKINMIIEDGTSVEKGDTVMIFDPTEVIKYKTDEEADLEIAMAELEKLKSTHQSRINELESDLAITEIAYQISEIKFEQSSYEADITKKEIKLNLEKAKISLEKAREEIENQKKIQKEEVQQSLLKIRQLQADVNEAQNTLDKLTVTSSSPGIAIIRHNWSSGYKWQVGDETWSGNPIIDLPDLSELMAKVYINEVDISNIRLGQKANIKLDAFSDTAYQGEVINVANLASQRDNNSDAKVFPVNILIKGTSEKLMPGMTVSCNINISTLENKTHIPLESLFKDETEEYVYLKSGNNYNKKTIKTGLSNNDYIIVEDGLKNGDVIALTNPNIKQQ